MAEENEDLLAAINAGIDNAGVTPPAPEVDDEADGDETAESGDVSGETPNAEGTDDGADDGDADGSVVEGEGDSEDGAEDESADGEQVRGPDGKFVKKHAAKAEAEAAAKEGKPAGADDKKPAAKDPINDPIPENLKKETRERMVSLVTAAKTISAERDTAIAERDELISIINETGSTPQQYGDAMNALRLLNSADPAEIEQGITFLQQVIAINAKAIGKPVPGVDFLADHKDLQEEVLNGTMSEERAIELAAMRSRTAISTAHTQHTNQQNQRAMAQERAITVGRDALNLLETQLKASDPQYAQKRAILVNAMRPVIAKAKPEEWAGIWKSAYENLKLPAPVKAVKRGVPANQPLRGKNPSGGQQKAPGSLLDAISMGIENASGR